MSVSLLAPSIPATEPSPTLNLVIIEGEGAINNIKLRTSRETIVEVQDENHKPVADAAVSFLLPDNGPGGTFATGSKSATVVTDSSGRATMPRLQLNSNPGRYVIHVTASHGGLTAPAATVAQASIAGAAAAISTGAIIGIVVGVAAAGAAGVVAATKHSSTPTPPPPTPTGTVGVGSGTGFGPPH